MHQGRTSLAHKMMKMRKKLLLKALKTVQQSKVRMKALKLKATLVMIWFLKMTILAKLTRQYLEDIVVGVDVDETLTM